MSSLDKAVKELTEILTETRKNQTSPYDTQAEVIRVDGDIAWVHIPGGVDETPVKLTMNAQVGDMVQVRVSGGNAWLQGNATAPPTDDTRANQAIEISSTSLKAAESAVKDAIRASEAAAQAEETAKGIEGIAESAKTAADTAFTNLSQVQSVLDVVNWVAQHGTYEKATVFNPNATYYTMTGTVVSEPSETDKDSQGVLIYYELDNGIYVRTTDTSVDDQKTYYRVTGTPVAQPDAEHIADYYTLAVTDAMADYIQAHLALTSEGLYVMKDGSEWKVQIADDGVYILDPSNKSANSMTKDGSIIGYEGETRVEINNNSLKLIAGDDGVYTHISDLRSDNSGEYVPSIDDTVQDDKVYFIRTGAGTQQDPYVYTKVENPSGSPKENGYYEMAPFGKLVFYETVVFNSNQTTYLLQFAACQPSYRVYQNDVDITDTGKVAIREDRFIFRNVSDVKRNDKLRTSEYWSNDPRLKAFTFGTRSDSLIGALSVSFGDNNEASKLHSYASGSGCVASGDYAHAEGCNVTASGTCSHAEGENTKALSFWSHAEGYLSKADAWYAHAEGEGTDATGLSSHAEGFMTLASGSYAHAEGEQSEAIGYDSHAQNRGTIAAKMAQTAIGRFNIQEEGEDPNGKYALIIGNGKNKYSRSNALTVDWDGNVELALDTTEPPDTTTTDEQIYQALKDLSWESDVIV